MMEKCKRSEKCVVRMLGEVDEGYKIGKRKFVVVGKGF